MSSKKRKAGQQKPGGRPAGPAAETLTLKLTGMAQGGEAFGRDEQGRVVFVPYAIAGEEVRVEIVESKKNLARGRPVEILSPSPVRVTPRCPHFGPIYSTLSANPQPG